MKKKIFLVCGGAALSLLLLLSLFVFWVFHRAQGKTFDSNGCSVHYTVDGEGPAVVLVHGLAIHSDLNWRRTGIIGMLDDDFQVIAMDLRGHGLTDKPTDPGQYGEEMAEDIVRLMDHLGIDKASVAGYSLGGFIALKAVAEHPERFRCTALCAAGWKDPEDPSEIPNPYKPPPAPHKELSMLFIAGSNKERSLFHRVRNGVGDKLIPQGARKAVKSSYTELAVTREQLENNTVPCICFIGDKDGLRPLGEALRRHMAELEYVSLKDKDHFTTCLSSEFRKGLREFLKRHGRE